MPWSGGTYSKWNNSSGGWAGDQAAGLGIESGRHDSQDNDFTTGINTCLAKDGSNAATGNLNLGSFKLTTVANGTARTDAATLGQVQDGTSSYLGTTGGTSTAFTVTATPTITALVTGALYTFKANTANGATPTLKIDATAATTIQRQGTALAGNEFKANDFVNVIYDGTNFQILNIASAPLFVDRTNNRIGIGTTAPASILDVQSTQTFPTFTTFSAAGTGPSIRMQKSRGSTVGTNTIVQNGDSAGDVYFFGANGSSYTECALIRAEIDGTPGATNDMPGRLLFYTTPDGTGAVTERMRITAAGRVGINNNGPAGVLHITNSESSTLNSVIITNTVAGDVSTAAVTITKKDNNSTTSQSLIQFLMNGGANGQGQINANGALQAAFGTYSDKRLKENVIPLPSQLQNIMALQPVEFDYKNGAGHQIGFIAQDVKTIYPDLVGEDSDGYLTLSGLGKNEARMIKAFQEFAAELQTKIAALEARIIALEG